MIQGFASARTAKMPKAAIKKLRIRCIASSYNRNTERRGLKSGDMHWRLISKL